MRKLLSLLLTLTFVVTLSACEKENTSSNTNASTPITQVETEKMDNIINSTKVEESSQNAESDEQASRKTTGNTIGKESTSVNNNETSEITKGTLTSKSEEEEQKIIDSLIKRDGFVEIASISYYPYLFVGEKTECRVVFSAIKPIKVKKWEVENSKIASIDEKGVVTAISEGTTYVVATLEDGQTRRSSFPINVLEYDRTFSIYENINGKKGDTIILMFSDDYSIETDSTYMSIINKTGKYGSETSNQSYNYKGDEPYYPMIILDSRFEFFGYLTQKGINKGYTLEEMKRLYENPKLYPGPDLYSFTFN